LQLSFLSLLSRVEHLRDDNATRLGVAGGLDLDKHRHPVGVW
jgi:hypothetical protein